jgi:short-subunit dehydrogenase
MKNTKRTALVTGASGGIGLELSRVLAREGNDLVLIARSAEKLEALAAELADKYGAKVKVMSKDLAHPAAPAEIFSRLKNENIHIDMLVNNAGFGLYGPFAGTSWQKEQMMIDLNVRALTELTKIFLPDMISSKYGRILNVASTAAFQPGPLMAVYYASKAYVLSFSEAIANELKGTGVTVTALCPGPTESGFYDAAALHESKLFEGKKLPTSAEVAEYGYSAMMKGKTVAIHGTMNWIMANSVRFTPRKVVAAVVRMMQERKG